MFPDTFDHSERAGQTMHTFDAYAAGHYQEMLNMSGADSLGQVNPELVRALGHANIPYIDDMAGSNIDGTQGFDELDNGANANNLRNLFAVIDSDDTAGLNFNAHAASTWKDLVADYSQGLGHTGIPDTELLKSVGKLQGAMDMGEYIHQLDSGKDAAEATQAAWEKKGQWYEGVKAIVGEIPKVSDAVAIYDKIPGDPLRTLFFGEEPKQGSTTPMQLRELDEVNKSVAAYLVHDKVGDLAILERYVNAQGELDWNDPDAMMYINHYLSNVAGGNDHPSIEWSGAYEAAITVSPGEYDWLLPKK
jgi:hypothetical protein